MPTNRGKKLARWRTFQTNFKWAAIEGWNYPLDALFARPICFGNNITLDWVSKKADIHITSGILLLYSGPATFVFWGILHCSTGNRQPPRQPWGDYQHHASQTGSNGHTPPPMPLLSKCKHPYLSVPIHHPYIINLSLIYHHHALQTGSCGGSTSQTPLLF